MTSKGEIHVGCHLFTFDNYKIKYIIKINDFPNPVGKIAITSTLFKSVTIAYSCSFFKKMFLPICLKVFIAFLIDSACLLLETEVVVLFQSCQSN